MESRNSQSSILSGAIVRDDKKSVTVHIPDIKTDGQAQIRLERQGKAISAIHITCKCGHQITIDCEYSNP